MIDNRYLVTLNPGRIEHLIEVDHPDFFEALEKANLIWREDGVVQSDDVTIRIRRVRAVP